MLVSNADLQDTAERGMQNPLRFSHGGTGLPLREDPHDMFAGMSMSEIVQYIQLLHRAGYRLDGSSGIPVVDDAESQVAFDVSSQLVDDHIAVARDPDASKERDPLYPWWDFGTTKHAIESLMYSTEA